MEHFCKNHPKTMAKKRCHQCKEYICPECQIDFMQKPFCSTKCLLKALFNNLGPFLKTRALFNISPTNLFQSIKKRKTGLLLGLIILIVLCYQAITIHSMKQQILSLPFKQKIPEQILTEPDSSGLYITTKPDAMVLENNISIKGEAAENTIISLKVNGKLTAVTLGKDSIFTFNNIKLKYGSNDIIVQGIDIDGHTSVLQQIKTIYGRPRLDYLARDFSKGNPKRPNIALTFDGGSGNGAAAQILDYLKEKKITCTIFLTGQFLKRYPNLAKRIVDEGHEVGNHTWSHPHLTTYAQNHKHLTLPNVNKKMLQKELVRTADLFYKITQQKMKPLWRAPYGEHNAEIRQWAAEIGYRHVGWTFGNGENMDTLDWVSDTTSTAYKTPDQVLQKLLNFGEDTSSGAKGGIILMHLDTQRNHDQVHQIIPVLIDSMRQRGYKFSKISEMMQLN